MYIYVYFLHIWILYFILFSTSTVSSANVVCMLCRQAVAGGEQAWHLGTLLYHHILPVCRRRQASKQASRQAVCQDREGGVGWRHRRTHLQMRIVCVFLLSTSPGLASALLLLMEYIEFCVSVVVVADKSSWCYQDQTDTKIHATCLWMDAAQPLITQTRTPAGNSALWRCLLYIIMPMPRDSACTHGKDIISQPFSGLRGRFWGNFRIWSLFSRGPQPANMVCCILLLLLRRSLCALCTRIFAEWVAKCHRKL